MYEDIHREEAESTAHDADLRDLHGEAPPCRECGTQPVDPTLDDRLCADCAPTISCALCTFLVEADAVVDLGGDTTAVCTTHARAVESGAWRVE